VSFIHVRFECNLNFLGSFSKNPHIEFHKNPSSGNRVVSCGRTNRDRNDETNRRFSQFCKRAQNQNLNCPPLRMKRRAVVEPSVWSCIPFWVITGTVDGQSFGNYYLCFLPSFSKHECGNHKHVFPFTFENASNRRVEVCFMRMPVVTMTMGNGLKVYQCWGEYFDSRGKE